MNATSHWRRALPYYLQASLRFSLMFWLLPLAVGLTATLWIGITTHHLAMNRVSLGMSATLGGGFFCLALLTSVVADIHRNRRLGTKTIQWNPSTVWKTFIYLGAIFFLVAAFLSYHQGAWLSAGFIGFSIGSAIVAKFCFPTGSPAHTPE